MRPVQCPRCGSIERIEHRYDGELLDVRQGHPRISRPSYWEGACTNCDLAFSVKASSDPGELFAVGFVTETAKPAYVGIPFGFDDEIYLMYDVIVRAGPPVDVHLLTPTEYEYFERNERFETLFSNADVVDDEATIPIAPGEYRFLVDTGRDLDEPVKVDVAVAGEAPDD